MTVIHSVRLSAFAFDLFGPSWAASVSRLTGVDVRTIRRIREAANEGREYPNALRVHELLTQAVRGIVNQRGVKERHSRAKAGPGRSLTPAERVEALKRR